MVSSYNVTIAHF